MRALIIAFAYHIEYSVMRLAAAAGYTVYVLGRECAAGLKYSNVCAGYYPLAFDPLSGSLGAARAEIEQRIKELSIDVVLPSDVVSTRLLAAIGPQLSVPTCALPSAADFDRLNDKWQFYQLCKAAGVRVPETRLFEDGVSVRAAIDAGELAFPLIVKPLDFMSQRGIYPLRDARDLSVLAALEYKPVLAQRFIDGEEGGVSIVARNGKICAYAVQMNRPGTYVYVRDEDVLRQASLFAAASNYNGVAHLDFMREAKTGATYLLECNPRYWYSIYALGIAGLNVVQLSIDSGLLDVDKPLCVADRDVRTMKAIVRNGLKTLRLTASDMKVLRYTFADPLGGLCAKLPMFDDDAATGIGSIESQVAALAALRAAARE